VQLFIIVYIIARFSQKVYSEGMQMIVGLEKRGGF
jgi:hypothetical protein